MKDWMTLVLPCWLLAEWENFLFIDKGKRGTL